MYKQIRKLHLKLHLKKITSKSMLKVETVAKSSQELSLETLLFNGCVR